MSPYTTGLPTPAWTTCSAAVNLTTSPAAFHALCPVPAVAAKGRAKWRRRKPLKTGEQRFMVAEVTAAAAAAAAVQVPTRSTLHQLLAQLQDWEATARGGLETEEAAVA